ncbi:amino acid adenylation domain-containing protein [Bacillus sp. S13(2024)]|uniref:amino acid adenylation domain-containing protein n=1 Tax=unclassified Bacillus (in: firmicutes) TaxID=185979 RepID=UPI003D1C076A
MSEKTLNIQNPEVFDSQENSSIFQNNLITLFEREVKKHPGKIAVSDKNTEISYQELDMKSEIVANKIRNEIIGDGKYIGIVAERTAETIIGILGIIKAGFAYMPIDESYPDNRIKYLLKDSGTNYILTQHEESLKHLMLQTPILNLNKIDYSDDLINENNSTLVRPEDLAYLIYTSGTTGTPKGVMVEHRNIIRLVKETNYCNFEDVSILQTGSLSFDASTFEIWGALLNGGHVHIAEKELLGDINLFKDVIRNLKINTMFITTALFNQFVSLDAEAFNLLKQLYVGGEAVSEEHVKLFLTYKSDDLAFYNIYGPTEATTFSLFHPIKKLEKTSNKTPIGQPISHTTAYIFQEGFECEVGEIGELYLGGIGISRGYLNQDVLTQGKFVCHPQNYLERLYRTGDLVKKLPDGNIEYVGRIDDQVKLRGFRIELGEIESRLKEIAQVKNAIVILTEDAGEKYLCAYIIEDSEIAITDLKDKLNNNLPDYMIPAHFIKLDEFPLTLNGKIDKKSLPKPIFEYGEEYIQPDSVESICVANAFSEVLGVEKVSLNSNFFDYGGDSIKAIRMVSSLREKGFNLSMESVIKEKTVGNIAKTIEKIQKYTINQSEITGNVKLTPIQSQFFESDMEEPNHFNQSVLFESEEQVDSDILSQTIFCLVKHHDMLRAKYSKDGNQIIKPISDYDENDFNFLLFDLMHLNEQNKINEMILSEGNNIQKLLNLEEGPILKGAIFRTKDKDYVLICVHHLVIDGISWRIIAEDLNYGYQKTRNGEKIEFPNKTVSFQEWSEELHKYRNSDKLSSEIPYWLEVEKNIPNSHFDNKAVTEKVGTEYEVFQISEETTNNLLYNSHKAYNTEINDLLLTALFRTVNKLTGQTDISILMEGHGRESIGKYVPIDRTVGWFTTIYPVSIKDIGKSISDDLCNTKENFRKIPNHGFGYSVLKYCGDKVLKDEIPDITFNYLGNFSQENNGLVLKIKDTDHGEQVSKFNRFGSPIVVDCVVIEKELNVTLIYNSGLFEESFIHKLKDYYMNELDEVVSHCMSSDVHSTPSDKGELSWSLSEYKNVERKLKSKNQGLNRIYPLTSLQEGMLFHKLENPDSSVYFVQNIFRLEGKVNKEHLSRSLNLLQEKYPALSVSIIHKEVSEYRQAVITGRSVELNEIDLSTSVNINSDFDKVCRFDMEKGFDLEDDNLIRAILVKYSEEEYRLILSFHHIIMDGWCTSIVINDLLNFYTEISAGKEICQINNLEKIGSTYEDFVYLMREKNIRKGIEYWKELLEDYDNQAMILPCGEVEQNNDETGLASIHLRKDEKEKLEELSRKHGVTLNTIIEAVWGILLQRYTNQDDIVFGKVVSGRNVELKDIDKMVGLFINTIPVRVKTDRNDTFLELLTSLQNQALESGNFDYCPLNKIQSQCTDNDSLITTIVGFENYYETNIEQTKDFSLYFEKLREQTNYPLSLDVLNEENLTLKLMYDAQIYNNTFSARLLENLHSIILSIIEEPDIQIKNIEMIGEQEKQIVLSEFNNTQMTYLNDRNIIEVFEATVANYPDSIALRYKEETLTYKELNHWANSIGEEIRNRGISKNDFVGIISEKSFEMFAGILGILKSGAGYLPLDPGYPMDRINFMLSDSNTKLVITSSHIKDLKEKFENISFLDIEECYSSNKNNLSIISSADDAAYMIYTSGTTGTPKGVIVGHKNVINLVEWQKNTGKYTETTEVLQFFNYIFDGSVMEIFPTLLTGATLVIVPEEDRNNPEKLLELMRNRQVIMVQSMFKIIVDYTKSSKKELLFEKVYLGGECVPIDLVRQLKELIGEKIEDVYNLYGPTECTVCSTGYNFNSEEDLSIVLIGKPIANTQLFILNENQICGIGVPGELCISGDGVARGYLNRPDLTEEKFVENPYLPGQKVYRTGDLARWTPDGNIDYLGRIDEQVKIRGFRIELGEIESKLRALPEVSDAVVLVKENNGSKIICGYIITESSVEPAYLKEELSQNLPEYMIPACFVQLEEFPRTRTGKLDRKALPDPSFTDLEEYIEPRNEREEAIVQVFQDVLNIDGLIGIDANFFSLGGDSIKAIRIISKLREKGYSLKVPDIMDKKTPRRIAQCVQVKEEVLEIDQSEVIGEVPLIPIQKAFIAHKGMDKYHFNQSVFLQIPTGLALLPLKQALRSLTIHHDMLRATYRDGKQIILSVADSEFVAVESYDYTAFPLEKAYAMVDEQSTKIQASMDLENGPLLRAGVFQLQDGDYLLLSIHHLVVDGVSWRILIEDLKVAYEAAKNGKEIQLPPKTHSFKEWGLALQSYRESSQLQSEVNYWKTVESKVNTGKLLLPVKEGGLYLDPQKVTMSLSKKETENLLQKAGTAYSTEINDLLLTAVGRAVNKITGQTSLAIHMEGHGREAIVDSMVIDRTVGWFTSTYPVVLEELGDSIGMDISKTKETLRRIPHHGIGYGILNELGETVLEGVEPDLTFNYLGEFQFSQSGEDFSESSLSHGRDVSEKDTFHTKLSLDGAISDKKLNVVLSFNGSEYVKEEMDAFIQAIKDELLEVIQHCLEQKETIRTPFDLGEENWSLEEYNHVVQKYAEKGYEVDRIIPMTGMQEGMLYHKLLNEESSEYVVQSVYSVSGLHSVEHLKMSLDLLKEKHGVLETSIAYQNVSEPRQVMLKGRDIEFNEIDLSQSKNQEKEREAFLKEDVRRGFDLENDSLIRVAFIHLENESPQLVISFHHIIMDGWCMSILMNDLSQFYSKLESGISKHEISKELHSHYDYEEYIRTIKFIEKEEAIKYWSELLNGYDTNAQIEINSNCELESEEIIISETSLSIETTTQLEKLCRTTGVTMNTFLETIWGVLLQKHIGQRDVVFGKVVSGRDVEINNIESTIGLFINTIPVRVVTKQKSQFNDLLKEMQKQALSSNEYDHYSLAEIQTECTNLGKDLVKSAVVFENYYKTEQDKDNKLKFELKDNREQTNYDMTLVGYQSEQLQLKLMTNANCYDENISKKLLFQLLNIVEQVLQDPSIPVSNIQISSKDEIKQIIDSFSKCNEISNVQHTILELFEQQVRIAPYKIALSDDNNEMTYLELEQLANRLASKLLNDSEKGNDYIGLVVERNIYTVVSMLAILKAGYAYLPIDPDYPPNRINYLISDSGLKIVLVQDDRLANFIDDSVLMINTNKLEFTTIEENVYQSLDMNPNDIACVIYTSGTTGHPKGTMIEHKSIIRLVKDANYADFSGVSILQTGSLSFDASHFEIWGSLLNGGYVHIADKEVLSNIELLKENILSKQINTMFITTALFNQYVEIDPTIFNSLKQLYFGGEATSNKHVKRLMENKKESLKLYNVYGPTEATTFSLFYPIDNSIDFNKKIPIGKPITNTSAVVKSDNMICGIGIPGELYIGGPGLARGYLNNNKLNEDKFLIDKDINGERFYKTGDLVKWDNEGNLIYLGRIDKQVKLNGFRIELEEIENRLKKLNSIQNATILLRNDNGFDYLCAYLIQDEDINEEEIKSFLREELPEYMIPQYFIRLKELPVTINGKIDSKALPVPEFKGKEQQVLPKNEWEQITLDIFQDVLNICHLSVKDSFIDMGGNSLKAIRLVNMIEMKTKIRITLQELFQLETIEKVAERLSVGEENEEEYYVPLSSFTDEL